MRVENIQLRNAVAAMASAKAQSATSRTNEVEAEHATKEEESGNLLAGAWPIYGFFVPSVSVRVFFLEWIVREYEWER